MLEQQQNKRKWEEFVEINAKINELENKYKETKIYLSSEERK